MMPEELPDDIFIGCCGAYCRTCMGDTEISGPCKGCRLGYEDGTRSFGRARCRVKRCCLLEKGLPTCMQCAEFDSCALLHEFYDKVPRRQKIRRAAEFIREHGVERFVQLAEGWTNSTGDLPESR